MYPPFRTSLSLSDLHTNVMVLHSLTPFDLLVQTAVLFFNSPIHPFRLRVTMIWWRGVVIIRQVAYRIRLRVTMIWWRGVVEFVQNGTLGRASPTGGLHVRCINT